MGVTPLHFAQSVMTFATSVNRHSVVGLGHVGNEMGSLTVHVCPEMIRKLPNQSNAVALTVHACSVWARDCDQFNKQDCSVWCLFACN